MLMPEAITIMQGDQYIIPFKITDGNDKVLTDETIQNVEITIDNIRKDGSNIMYNSETKTWDFPLYQEESMYLEKRSVPVQIRVVLQNNDIVGVDLGNIKVIASISKEVL